jgi:hypothetical protein
MGTVYGYHWPSDTTFTEQYINNRHTQLTIPSKHPEIIYMKIDGSSYRYPGLPESWDAGVIPIFFREKIGTKVSKDLKISGFPLAYASAITVHKTQGATLTAIIISGVDKGISGTLSKSLYVAISRVKIRDQLFLYDKYTNEDYLFFCPSEEAIEADKKLWLHSNQTLKKNNFSLHPEGQTLTHTETHELLDALPFHLRQERPTPSKKRKNTETATSAERKLVRKLNK